MIKINDINCLKLENNEFLTTRHTVYRNIQQYNNNIIVSVYNLDYYWMSYSMLLYR